MLLCLLGSWLPKCGAPLVKACYICRQWQMQGAEGVVFTLKMEGERTDQIKVDMLKLY